MQRVRGEAFFMAVLVAAGLVLPADAATKRSALDRLKEKGWTLEPLSTPGAYCARAVPPASDAGARPLASCAMESKGLAFGLYVFKSTVTADQVKSPRPTEWWPGRREELELEDQWRPDRLSGWSFTRPA